MAATDPPPSAAKGDAGIGGGGMLVQLVDLTLLAGGLEAVAGALLAAALGSGAQYILENGSIEW